MADLDTHRVKETALRVARLASLNAPAIILLYAADSAMRQVERLCQSSDLDVAAVRAERLAQDAAAAGTPPEPLSAEEEAEIAREEAAHSAAEARARAAADYSDEEWSRLDHAYRFDLIMGHYEAPAPIGAEVRADG